MINQDKLVALKINAELLNQIKAIADQENRSLSSMIRVAIKEYIKSKK